MKTKIVLRVVLVGFLALQLSVPLGVQPMTLVGAEEPTPFPDLELGFMISDPPLPSTNQNVMIVAQIFNNGSVDVTSVQVNFYANSSLIGCTKTSVLAGTLNKTSISWIPASSGVYNVSVVVDPLDKIVEGNENNNVLSEFVFVEAEWFVEGTGTFFEITSSEYLNITLTSSDPVHIRLESVPRMVSFFIENNSSAILTLLTLAGFEPHATYSRYQDCYLLEHFTTDSTGGYTYAQDISQGHHVFIQEEGSTIYIRPDGTVDPPTAPITVFDNVYTFTEDIYETIVVDADNIVIDGNGYTLQGSGSGTGFYVNGRSHVTITNVTVSGWTYGIYLIRSSSNNISGNTIRNNINEGVRLDQSSHNNISGNTIRNNIYEGIRLDQSSHNNISGNTITANNRPGIWLRDSSNNNSISGNTITKNRLKGIRLDGLDGPISLNNNISGNTITANYGEGILLIFSSNHSISGNTITANRKHGIYLWKSPRNSISGNTITANNEHGIWIIYYSNNNISGNTITANNGHGILLDGPGSNHNISGNTITANNGHGILLRYSANNVIYHNNFIDNGVQASDTHPANNDWHHPGLQEGNYWSDYPGSDDGSGTGKHEIAGDGIGDTDIPWPPTGDYDFYPFVTESGWVVVDTTPPETTISLSGTLGLEGWYVSDVTVTLTATDDISWVAETAYSFDGINWITYTDPFTITTEGSITVYYNSTDSAGNVEATKTEIIQIDKTPPITDLTYEPYYVDEAGTIYVTAATEFILTATDVVSGVAHTSYRINGSDWIEYGGAFTLVGLDGTYIIDYYSVDVAGNEETPKSATISLISLKINSYLTDSGFNPITSFDIVFREDKKSGGYVLVATNPGQFYFNIEVLNDWSIAVDTLTLEAYIPEDFVLKGARPIQVYLDGTDITKLCTIDNTTITVTNMPAGSRIYVTIHVDYALKKTSYESLDTFGIKGYIFAVSVSGSGGSPSVPDGGFLGTYSASATLIAHQKKTTAIVGFVSAADGTPVVNATVELFDSNGDLIGTTVTVEDGFYYFLGIEAGDYTVQVTSNGQSYTHATTATKDDLTQVDFTVE